MARPEQVLILEPQHELKFRGKRGGPGLDGRRRGVPLLVGLGMGHDGVSVTKAGRNPTIRFDNMNKFRTFCQDDRSSNTSAPS